MHRARVGYSLKFIILLSLMMFLVGFLSGLGHLEDGRLLRFLPETNGKDILAWYLPGETTVEWPWSIVYQESLSPAAIFSNAGVPMAYAMEVTAEPETTLPYPETDGSDEPTDEAKNNEGNPSENDENSTTEESGEPDNTAGETTQNDASQPLVGIYCTHNAECYTPTSGTDRLEGKNGGVYQVAKELKAALTKEGIGSVLCDTIHDYPNWSLSYQNSLASMQKMKKQYPSLEIFIDVHRDVKPTKGTTVYQMKDGTTAAKIMLIVGSNKRLEHPNWQKNLAFSQKIGAELNQEYPGIIRGVRVQSGRYNQHFSPKAILVEFGSTENTLTEAKNSADVLAKVLKDVAEK